MGPGDALMRRRALLAGAAALPLAACGPAPRGLEGGFIGTHPERGHLMRQPRPDASGLTGARTPPRARVLIAGAGVAGLAAARALAQAGIDDVVLIDLEDEAGGNARGTVMGGLPCPLGAHYLPVPGDDAREVQDLLEDLGLRRRVAGRWRYDERHLCHSPQERLLFQGEWQEGLLPLQGVGEATRAQYRRFAARVADLSARTRFVIPAFRAPLSATRAQLAAQTFEAWLAAEGLDDAHLRWYLDYCCRDDYGAGLDVVSAWAGIHYFASRHGFHAPGAGDAPGDVPGDGDESGVLTWPEGNGWLTRALARRWAHQPRLARTVLDIRATRSGVELIAFDHASGQHERWQADACVVALPLHVAARVVAGAPAGLRDAAARTPQAAWLVANLHLEAPLHDRPGAAPSWDNVLYGSPGLGYVDARHQSLDPRPGPTVLTWYQALGASPAARRELLQAPWSRWRDAIVPELAAAHPDLPQRLTRLEVTRHGHAMAVPVPVVARAPQPAVITHERLWFAHADWSGYSIFEEAFTRGHLAGESVARAVRLR
jgi:predicted NAD/FAD-dependent oxidoreductase